MEVELAKEAAHVLSHEDLACFLLAKHFLLEEILCNNNAASVVAPPDGADLLAADKLPQGIEEGTRCGLSESGRGL